MRRPSSGFIEEMFGLLNWPLPDLAIRGVSVDMEMALYKSQHVTLDAELKWLCEQSAYSGLLSKLINVVDWAVQELTHP